MLPYVYLFYVSRDRGNELTHIHRTMMLTGCTEPFSMPLSSTSAYKILMAFRESTAFTAHKRLDYHGYIPLHTAF